MGYRSSLFREGATWPLVAAGLLAASPSAAQRYQLPGERLDSPICSVFAGSSADGLREVRARCWGTALSLGYADSFRVMENRELRSTLVELEHSGKRRLLLIRPTVGDRPMLEDISGMLAVAAGRFSSSGIDGLTLDVDEFGTSGRIGVASESSAAARLERERSSDAIKSSTDSIEVSIGEYIARDTVSLVVRNASTPETE